jgi:hypothetical protein
MDEQITKPKTKNPKPNQTKNETKNQTKNPKPNQKQKTKPKTKNPKPNQTNIIQLMLTHLRLSTMTTPQFDTKSGNAVHTFTIIWSVTW